MSHSGQCLCFSFFQRWIEADSNRQAPRIVTASVRIIGIDPGSRVTGWGIIETSGRDYIHIANGCLRLGDGPFDQRLRALFEGLQALVAEHAPQEAALEDVFMNKNAMSALKLGQARGAALAAVACLHLPVAAYSPAKVKQSIVGNGRAEKEQVNHMVRVLLNLTKAPQADAADALGVAISHAHWRASPASRLDAMIAKADAKVAQR